jgi:hypothetical protein
MQRAPIEDAAASEISPSCRPRAAGAFTVPPPPIIFTCSPDHNATICFAGSGARWRALPLVLRRNRARFDFAIVFAPPSAEVACPLIRGFRHDMLPRGACAAGASAAWRSMSASKMICAKPTLRAAPCFTRRTAASEAAVTRRYVIRDDDI